jgi:vitamin B12 transporter
MKKFFFVLAAVIFSSWLKAQDSSSIDLDEVVMTANKYPNKSSLTGKVISVITREQLQNSGAKDLPQVLAEQAGLYIAGANSNPGKDKSVYLRGARIDHTLITIDGVPLYDPAGVGGNFDLRNIAVSNVERIEILKGSQSTLYGSDAIAGVINIITKKSGDKSFSGTAGISYGSFNTLRSQAGINGKKRNTDFSVNYSLQKTSGINEANSNDPLADKDSYHQQSINASVGVRVNQHIRIQPFARFTKLKGDLDQGAFTDELDYTYSQHSFQTGLRNEITLGKTKLNLVYSFNSIRREYKDDSIKSRNGFDIYSYGRYNGREHFADAYAHIPLTEQMKLTTGIDFRQSSSGQEYLSVSSFGNYTSQYSRDSLHQTQTGLYAALNYNTKHGFSFEAGNRLNIQSEYGTHDVFNLNPSWLLKKRLKLFANLSSGYRTPSLYQLFSEYGNKELKPESAVTSEAGFQYFSNDKKFNGRALVFRRNIKDVIFFYYNSATFQSQYINQDRQKDKGFELEASYQITKETTVKGFYTFVTGEVSTTLASGKDTTYFNLLRRPKNSFGIYIGSQVNPRFFISSQFSAFGKRNDAYFDPQSFTNIQTTLKAYSLWDVFASYSFGGNKAKCFIDFRNILNAKYTEVSGFNTLGFAVYGGFSFQF